VLQQARLGGALPIELAALESYQGYARLFLNQIERRVIQGEKIPHEEKLFSIFQPHTEWISKDKAGVPVELGFKACIMEDQHRLTLHHQVMEKQTNDAVAVEMVAQSRKHFPELAAASFDKGFHSKANQAELKNHLKQVILPKKAASIKRTKRMKAATTSNSCANNTQAWNRLLTPWSKTVWTGVPITALKASKLHFLGRRLP